MVAMHHSDRRSGNRNGSPQKILGRVKDGASEVAGYVTSGARAATRQVRQTAGELTNAVVSTLEDEAERLFEQQKDRAVSRVASISKLADRTAHALHAVKADPVAKYLEDASRRVDDAADYLKESTLTQVLEDTGEVVRRNRGLVMGGMFLAGFALTRFLKATESRDDDDGGTDADEENANEQRRGGGRARNGAMTKSSSSARRGSRQG